MKLTFFRRREVWFPTLPGWVCLGVAMAVPLALWAIWGESFLARTDRLAAPVLVVEGWIGQPGIRAAGEEFRAGGYELIVTTGGTTGSRWGGPQRWDYAEEAAKVLVRAGIEEEKILVASSGDTEAQRTHESALAVKRVLGEKGLEPPALNIFTLDVHARRTALIFRKVHGAGRAIGTIAWSPSEYRERKWWNSSERTGNLVTETAAYLFEVLLNSGRPFFGGR